MKYKLNKCMRNFMIMAFFYNFLYLVSNLMGQGTTNTPAPNLLPPPGFATRLDYLRSLTNEADAINAYRNGLINKNELMLVHFQIGNLTQHDFYGRVVDQYGKPVSGADVTGYLRSDEGVGINDEKVETFVTQTDTNGLFQFTGLHGARFGQKVAKEGYEMRDEGYIRQVGGKTSADDRATFMMWKLKGAEPMIHRQFKSRVPYDGTSARFDLMSGKKTNNGDLKITLLRSPLIIRRGWDKYNWTVKIEMPDGGLLAENDPYPYWAPATGYQSIFETGVASNEVPWNAELRQNFYIKNARGQYGRMFIDLSTDSVRANTGITVQTWINPSGSQNLEFDSKKEITGQ